MDYILHMRYNYYQGRIKRRGHATAIYQIANGRGRASKNRQGIIARALHTLRPRTGCYLRKYNN